MRMEGVITVNIDNYSEAGKREILKARIETIRALDKDDPDYKKYFEILNEKLKEYIPQDIIGKFEIIKYGVEDFLLHEDYTSEKRFLFMILKGTVWSTLHQKFISAKIPYQLLGTVGLHSKILSPSSTIKPHKGHVIAARLEISEEDYLRLMNNAQFLRFTASDLAERVIQENAYNAVLSNSNLSILAAYILVNTDDGEIDWIPNKTDVANQLNFYDHSMVNKYIKMLIEIGSLEDVTSEHAELNSKQRAYRPKDSLVKILHSIDYHPLHSKYGAQLFQ